MHPGRHPPNHFSNAPLRRQGELRKDPERLKALEGSGSARFLLVAGERNLVSRETRALLFCDTEAAMALMDPEAVSIYLGELDDAPLFAADAGDVDHERLGAELGACTEGLRTLGLHLDPAHASLAAYARAMVLWDRRHRFCGRCGGNTLSAEGGHVRRCAQDNCGNSMFPRVDPAIIVLVSDGDHALLGRQASWDEGRYSTLAGFVEPGESLEEAVVREVHEETGVGVTFVDYHSSQPWPFPSSLMLGFSARAPRTPVRTLDGELEHADWFSRDDIRERRITLPYPVSISYRLIEHWYDGDEPGRMARDLGDADPDVKISGSA